MASGRVTLGRGGNGVGTLACAVPMEANGKMAGIFTAPLNRAVTCTLQTNENLFWWGCKSPSDCGLTLQSSMKMV